VQPELHSLFADERLRDDHDALERKARATKTVELEPVTIRPSSEADVPAIERLATLDDRRVPPGPLLLAEIGGRIEAAVGVEGGETVANPFARTSEALSLLQLRARQLRAA
jgi:hypothetical protein